MEKIYYSPKGFWKGFTAIDKLSQAAKVSKAEAKKWLMKQAIWQIYLPAPKRIPRRKFDIPTPNEAHQADLLFLPHDKVGRKTYKYALTIVDVASRYKEAEPLSTKNSSEVAKALEKIYKRSPLKWPKVFQVDPGREFMGDVNKLFAKHNVLIRRGEKEQHRSQSIDERFNRTLSERLFGYQYAEELKNYPSKIRSTEWARRLPAVIKALNNEETRLTGKKPVEAIKLKMVVSQHGSWVPKSSQEVIIPDRVQVRYLYEPGELEGGQRRRATDPNWSLKTYEIDRYVTKDGEPTLYYLKDGPKRSFVKQELLIVPFDTVPLPKGSG